MSVMKLLYRDVDRTPYLYTLKYTAKRLGLELEMEKSSGPDYGDHLQAGRTDVLAENYWGLQSYRARGFPFVSLASSVTWMNEKLLVHPSITKAEDLRGNNLQFER